jgi:uncharacterized protein YcfJ
VKSGLVPLLLAAAPILNGCATDAYGRSDAGSRATAGVLVGGALGALAGHSLGIGTVAGAAAGMVAGGAAGIVVKGPVIHDRQYYRDSQGYCYYVDPAGNPKYDPKVRC